MAHKNKPGDYIGQTFLMSNKFIDGEAIVAYTSPGVISYKKSYDSILVNNLIFNDVVWLTIRKTHPKIFQPLLVQLIPQQISILLKTLDSEKACLRYHF
jgi:hypothetical protein